MFSALFLLNLRTGTDFLQDNLWENPLQGKPSGIFYPKLTVVIIVFSTLPHQESDLELFTCKDKTFYTEALNFHLMHLLSYYV